MPERFVRPAPRVDNIGMPVSAADVNVLQEIGVWTQQAAFRQGDEQFQQRVMLTMLNNPLINRGWVDLFADASFLDMSHTTCEISVDERAVTLPAGVLAGTYQSRILSPQGIRRIRFVLGLVDVHLPNGCTCTWEISTNNTDWYPLPQGGDPQPLPRFGTTLCVRAVLTRPSLAVHPQIRGVAVLFEDYNTGQVTIDSRLKIVPPTNYDGPLPGQDGPGTGGSTEPGEGLLDGVIEGEGPTGTISHWDLSDVHPDQHHAKNHRHNHDGIEPVHLGEDTVGTLPLSQLPSQIVLENNFLTLLPDDLVYLSQLNEAIQNIYNRIKQEFPDDLAEHLPHTRPEDFPCFVPVRMPGDVILERNNGNLGAITTPRERILLARVLVQNGSRREYPLAAVLTYSCNKATADILIRAEGQLQMVRSVDLSSPPGAAAQGEVDDILFQLGYPDVWWLGFTGG